MWAPRGVLVVVLLAAVAEAAPIRMQLSIEFTGDGFSTFQLIASNVGEEAAHQLAAETFFTGTSQTTDTLETLGPGQRHTWAASIPPPTGVGTFPLLVGLRYADRNDHPFSARLVHVVPSPGAPASPVHGRLELQPTTTRGSGTFYLDNPTTRALHGRVSLLLPRELTAEPANQSVEVPAQDRLAVPLSFLNTEALGGSSYPATALFEYDTDEAHFTIAANTVVDIAAPTNDRTVGWGIAFGLGTLLAVTIVSTLWRSR